MGFMANAPSVLAYGLRYRMIGKKIYQIGKCDECGKNTGQCKHYPKEKLALITEEKKMNKDIPETIKIKVYWTETNDGFAQFDFEEMQREFDNAKTKLSNSFENLDEELKEQD